MDDERFPDCDPEALLRFARRFTNCPVCGERIACRRSCSIVRKRPHLAELMQAARRAVYGDAAAGIPIMHGAEAGGHD